MARLQEFYKETVVKQLLEELNCDNVMAVPRIEKITVNMGVGEAAADKKVLDLHYSLCPNMFKISPKNLLWALENIGKVNVITVPEEIRKDARLALDRMLALAPKAVSTKKNTEPIQERQMAGI